MRQPIRNRWGLLHPAPGRRSRLICTPQGQRRAPGCSRVLFLRSASAPTLAAVVMPWPCLPVAVAATPVTMAAIVVSWHSPLSSAQDSQSSLAASHSESPHEPPHTPQSTSQAKQSSPGSQLLSPRAGSQARQSAAQDPQLSIGSQMSSPHNSPHSPQSSAHEPQPSIPSSRAGAVTACAVVGAIADFSGVVAGRHARDQRKEGQVLARCCGARRYTVNPQ